MILERRKILKILSYSLLFFCLPIKTIYAATKKIMKSRAPIKITTVKQSEDFENPEDYYGI